MPNEYMVDASYVDPEKGMFHVLIPFTSINKNNRN